MMREPSENLRRYPRFHVDVQANVRTLDGRKLAARTRDLSRSGICLVTPEDLASGAKLSIELVLLLGPTSSSEPLPLRARVVWCTAIGGAYQIGAMFDGLSAKESSFLDMFLRYLDGTILPAGAEMDAIDDGEESPAGDDDGRTPSPDIKDDPFRS
jgi:PilZ domain